MVRAKFFARSAMAVALSLGVAVGGFSTAEAKDKKQAAPKAPQLKPTEKFVKLYIPAAKALEVAVKRPDVVAQRQKVVDAQARGNAAKKKADRDLAVADMNVQIAALQALLRPEKVLIDAAIAAGSNADDKLVSGQLLVNYGNVAIDKNAQKNGLQLQLDSGALPAENVGLVRYTLGRMAMEMGDMATAQREIKLAVDGGYTKDEAEFYLANSYLLNKQVPLGLKMLHDATVRNGATTPEYWIDNGLVQAFNNKLPGETSVIAGDLVTYYPTKLNWDRAIYTVTLINKYTTSDKIDLLRLRDRTGSFTEADNYLDYMVYASPNRLPAEVLRVIDLGVAAGMITPATQIATDTGMSTVAKVRALAQGRLAEDKNLLVVQERDALGAKGDAKTALSAGDAFLSHSMAAKAEAMYRLALTKPGVDASRANLRLGIVLYDQGKYAEALGAFAKVTDARAPIAQLWTVQTKHKVAGK